MKTLKKSELEALVNSGLKVKEISEKLGIPVATIKTACKTFEINLRKKPRVQVTFVDDTKSAFLDVLGITPVDTTNVTFLDVLDLAVKFDDTSTNETDQEDLNF